MPSFTPATSTRSGGPGIGDAAGGDGAAGTTAGAAGAAKEGAAGAEKEGAAGNGAAGTGNTGAGIATLSAETPWPVASFPRPPEIIRVNSPGSETPAGSGPLAGNGDEAADD